MLTESTIYVLVVYCCSFFLRWNCSLPRSCVVVICCWRRLILAWQVLAVVAIPDSLLPVYVRRLYARLVCSMYTSHFRSCTMYIPASGLSLYPYHPRGSDARRGTYSSTELLKLTSFRIFNTTTTCSLSANPSYDFQLPATTLKVLSPYIIVSFLFLKKTVNTIHPVLHFFISI